jgi:hypothetical protein
MVWSWPRALGALFWAASIGVCAVGCSLAFDLGREQCSSRTDCENLGLPDSDCVEKVCVEIQSAGGQGGQGGSDVPLPPNWDCIDDFVAPDPMGEDILHTYRFEIATSDPGTPPENLEVRLCSALDTLCENGDVLPADETGTVVFEEPLGFTGFLEMTGNDVFSGDGGAGGGNVGEALMPTIAFLQVPAVIPAEEKVIRVITPTAINALAAAADVPLDMSRGTSILLIHDCMDFRSAGVHFEIEELDPDTTPYHFRGALPDPNATQTDEQGAGGFVNMPVGLHTVSARHVESGKLIGKASFRSRAGTLSYVPMGPTEEE